MEKRMTLRRDWRAKIIFQDEFGEELLYLYSKDISLGGLFLEEAPPLALGSLAFLSFALPGKKEPLKVTGEVVRFTNGGHFAGIGVRFVGLEPEAWRQLSGFVNPP